MVYLDIVVSDQCCYAKNIVDKIDLKKLKTIKVIPLFCIAHPYCA